MAEGFLNCDNHKYDNRLEVFSAGTEPSSEVHPKAIQVMAELGIDISNNFPKSVELYLDNKFDFVITVCGEAKETCPVFTGEVINKLHIGFEDPANAKGSEDEILNQFRKIRDQIRSDIFSFLDMRKY